MNPALKLNPNLVEPGLELNLEDKEAAPVAVVAPVAGSVVAIATTDVDVVAAGIAANDAIVVDIVVVGTAADAHADGTDGRLSADTTASAEP